MTNQNPIKSAMSGNQPISDIVQPLNQDWIKTMQYRYLDVEGRSYRYSEERRISGRPMSIQYQPPFAHSGWRDVRNVDRSDQIWRLADEVYHDTI